SRGRRTGRLGAAVERRAGDADRVRALGLPPLHGHLRFDLVDLLERHRTVVRLGRDAALEERRAQALDFGRIALARADLAQHVELALAHEVVAPLALDHLLERGLAVFAFPVRLARVQIGPARGRVANELHHLREETAAGIVLGHGSWG